jgi:hypothetical protein
MGLDMYAYRLRADLAPAADTDVSVTNEALKHLGFELLSDEQLDALTKDQLQEYWKRKDKALDRAQKRGLVDTSFAYWRKFNNLHGWMERLYREKGGKYEFNCTTVRLNDADLDRLAQEAPDLEPCPGFFFGPQEPMTSEGIDEIGEFVRKAKQAIAQGYAVYYDSWW